MLTSGDLFAGYRIDRLLGQGGMGAVYSAGHPRLPRTTAVKLLNRELLTDPEIRARFEREADLVAQLEHPNIVTIYDRGVESGYPWISMQYIDGIDATGLGTTALEPAILIVENIAAALDFAHMRGIVHRDVKPANILLTHAGADIDRVFLTDFGIARLREDTSHLTRTGTFTATVAYAAPEQLTGGPVTAATDQYSLACTLFKLLTATGPFDAQHPGEVIRGHLQLDPPSLRTRRQGLPPALDGVLTRAMAKRPEDRYRTCGDFAQAVRAAAGQATQVRAEQVPAPTVYHPPQASAQNHAMAAAPNHSPMHGVGSIAPHQHRNRPWHPKRTKAFFLVAGVVALIAALALGKGLLWRPDDTTARLAEKAHNAYPTLLAKDDTGDCAPGSSMVPLEKGALKNAPVSTNWYCIKYISEHRQLQYSLLVFDSAATARSVVAGLPSNTATPGTKQGTSFTAHHWSALAYPPPAFPTAMRAEIVVTFENDPARSNTLVYAADTGDNLTSDPMLAWWQSVRL
ncbi:serine/threonine-protein kinase [Nocardia sp. NPDC050718]|uniref:serine/threonine-protein kinase n=1 Tax=Nocardia sp. NPDC050718 TaxID=3155788 RepID=UPI00340F089A